jgi:1-acyl-sn-glycerol-3-phosphate acyltransferase
MAAAAGLSGAMLTALTIEEKTGRLDELRRTAYARSWARSLLKVLDVDMTIEAAPGALEKSARPRLVVANHRSTVDILLVLDLFGGNLLARGDMAGWPGIGVMARQVGTLFVDRGDPASGAAAIHRMRERLRQGITVTVFPEGTTFAGDEVREFAAGAFVAIAREHGEVVPVGIAYEGEDAIFGDEPVTAHMKRLVRTPRTRVGVAIGAPVEAKKSVVSFAEQMRGEVQGLVTKARALVGGASVMVAAQTPGSPA